jgi:uncharacterized membrane protein YphA (DoxX/SURF4 family)
VSDIRRFTFAAAALLVVLRLGIGWQLLYEGLWKIKSLETPTPWSSEGYLKNSQGPLRSTFRSLTGDPDDLQWLDETTVAARWDDWRQRFTNHYGLNDGQKSRLNQMVDGASAFVAPLESLPPEVDFKAAKLDAGVISWDAAAKQLKIDGKKHLLPSEKQAIEELVAGKTGPEYDAFRKALNDAFSRSTKLSVKERLRAHLTGNPENAGRIDGRISELDLYRQMVERHQQKLTSAAVAFEYTHLDRVWNDTRAKAAEVAGPLKAMDTALKADALEMLTVAQLQRGPLPAPWTPLRIVDTVTIAGLTGLGGLLVLGLFSRFAALSAAFMVFGFYMAMPPWPGVPEAPGPEHSFIVNKNMIEVLALLALGFMPTGRWFGLDAILARLFHRKPRPAAGKP